MKLELLVTIKKSLDKNYSNRLILYLNSFWEHSIQSDKGLKFIIKILKEVSNNFNVELLDFEKNIEQIPNKYIKEKVEILVDTFKNSNNITLQESTLDILKKLGENYSNIIVSKLGKVFIDREDISVFVMPYKGLFESFDIDEVKKWVNKNGEDAAVVIARSLNSPEPKENNSLYVPELTEWILEKFETSDRVFNEFTAGRYSMQAVWVGEKIEEHDNLVKKMQPYLKHRLRRIREWAQWEIDYSKKFIKENEYEDIVIKREN
ncbi:hypothetical protein [Clostridium tyrobutyricum]|uniref:hypothetical protein n=1 Tax=Clostridium tyrobutyricum TaxID=1519 RepID=UPI0018A8DD25|nr:hypothetical protein [Clostridium tyrobutyricum]